MYWVNEFSRGGGQILLCLHPTKAWSLGQRDISRGPPPPCRPQPFQQQVSTGVHLNNSCVCACYLPDLLYGGYMSSKSPLRHLFFCWSMSAKAFLGTYHPPLYLYIYNWNLSFFFFSSTSSPISPGSMCLFPIEIERLMGLGSGRIECRKLFYRMPFRLHFYDPLERVLVEIA